mgnify:CR=1 FL=1
MLISGVDIGKKGAIAFINSKTLRAEVYAMPDDFSEIVSLFERKLQEDMLLVLVEKQQAFPKQGVVSTFKLGVQYGMILGILKALKIPYEEISAKKWQKVMLGNCGKKIRKEIKQLSLERAKNLFPYLDIGRHDGKADALLIAEYGRRILLSNSK